eukprot:1555659-Rhodomonas_salina.2
MMQANASRMSRTSPLTVPPPQKTNKRESRLVRCSALKLGGAAFQQVNGWPPNETFPLEMGACVCFSGFRGDNCRTKCPGLSTSRAFAAQSIPGPPGRLSFMLLLDGLVCQPCRDRFVGQRLSLWRLTAECVSGGRSEPACASQGCDGLKYMDHG